MNKRKFGNQKESEAIEYLIRDGYEIVQKNYYCKYGEIDIIAKKGDTYIFVEVKSRNNLKFGKGEYSINKKKKNKIYLTAMDYLYKNSLSEFNFRFDGIVFYKNEMKWLKDIIWGDELGF